MASASPVFDDCMDPSHLAELDFGTAFAAPATCPDCGSSRLTAQDAGDRTYFSCDGCRAEWAFRLGRIVRVTAGHAVPEPR